MAKMTIRVDEDGTLVIGEVFSGAYLETSEGNRVGFCMRDDTIEFNIWPKGSKVSKSRWFRVNMQTEEVDEMALGKDDRRAKAKLLTNMIIDDLHQRHHIQFGGKLDHTGRDMVSEKVVEPFLRALDEESKTDCGGSDG